MTYQDDPVPPGATVELLDLDGGRVRLLRSGGPERGRPLFLLHGGGTTNAAIAWRHLYAPLGANHEVIGIDFPGYGGTTGLEPIGDPDELAGFVARVADELGLADAVVFGGSMGGEVALRMALRHPHLVRGLVLVSPAGLMPIIGNRAAQAATWVYTRMMSERMWLAQTRLFRRFGLSLGQIVHDPETLPSSVLAAMNREADRPRAGLGLYRYLRATIGPREMTNNLLPVVDQITAPTLFVHGEHDVQQPPETSRSAVELMPNARRILLPDCGHWAQLEAPERFRSEVTDFLASVE